MPASEVTEGDRFERLEVVGGLELGICAFELGICASSVLFWASEFEKLGVCAFELGVCALYAPVWVIFDVWADALLAIRSLG